MAKTTYEMVSMNVCWACVYTDANGWDEMETGEPLPDPAPLALLPDDYGMGPDETDHICEGHFSWSACDACGCTFGGDRYCMTVAIPVLY